MLIMAKFAVSCLLIAAEGKTKSSGIANDAGHSSFDAG